MSKNFIFFTGVIFIIVFGVFQLALVSMVGKEDALTVIIGFFTVVVGLSGALVAYMIAREQIKHQKNSKAQEFRLEKLNLIKELLEDIDYKLVGISATILNDNLSERDKASYLSFKKYVKPHCADFEILIQRVQKLLIYDETNLSRYFEKEDVSVQVLEYIGRLLKTITMEGDFFGRENSVSTTFETFTSINILRGEMMPVVEKRISEILKEYR